VIVSVSVSQNDLLSSFGPSAIDRFREIYPNHRYRNAWDKDLELPPDEYEYIAFGNKNEIEIPAERLKILDD